MHHLKTLFSPALVPPHALPLPLPPRQQAHQRAVPAPFYPPGSEPIKVLCLLAHTPEDARLVMAAVAAVRSCAAKQLSLAPFDEKICRAFTQVRARTHSAGTMLLPPCGGHATATLRGPCYCHSAGAMLLPACCLVNCLSK